MSGAEPLPDARVDRSPQSSPRTAPHDMPTPYRRYLIETSHAAIAIEERGDQDAPPVLMIHGNSSFSGVFHHQMQSRLTQSYRLVAFDLPGHGASTNARSPERTYTRPGFGDVVLEVLATLKLERPALVGWSLGGHIALEAMSRLPDLAGVMICGTPPVGTSMSEGFNQTSHMRSASKAHLSPDEIESFGRAVFGATFDTEVAAAMTRAHGLARHTLFEAARTGAGVNQRTLVETSFTTLGVVNGADDSFVNLDYVDTPKYANLWDGRCHRIEDAGHVCFREQPRVFNLLLDRFLTDVFASRA